MTQNGHFVRVARARSGRSRHVSTSTLDATTIHRALLIPINKLTDVCDPDDSMLFADDNLRRKKMARIAQVVFITMILMSPAVAVAGPAEDANAAVDHWSAAFNTNDPETIAKNYCPDAILLGTVSPVISEGTQGIIKYFTPTKGTGNKNAIDER
ncbi:MAG TPA: hypothetical protein VFJ59_20735, partial [Pseudolabrys sp.]|nr:hypothetical protein [Pseudolabrys sp.]